MKICYKNIYWFIWIFARFFFEKKPKRYKIGSLMLKWKLKQQFCFYYYKFSMFIISSKYDFYFVILWGCRKALQKTNRHISVILVMVIYEMEQCNVHEMHTWLHKFCFITNCDVMKPTTHGILDSRCVEQMWRRNPNPWPLPIESGSNSILMEEYLFCINDWTKRNHAFLFGSFQRKKEISNILK